MARRVPQPLGFVAVDRRRTLGQRIKTHADDGQAACFVAISEDRDGEFGPGQIGLDEHGLGVGGEEIRHLTDELRAVLQTLRALTPLPQPSKAGFTKSGKGSRTARASPDCGRGRRARWARRIGEHLLGAALVSAEAERERIGGVIGDAEELADGRDVAFAVRAVEPLGDVEDEVGTGEREARGEQVLASRR